MIFDSKATPYGKYLKKIRIDHDQTIAVMAKHLEISPSYLASIETGAREIPAGFSSKLVELYGLDAAEVEELVLAESRTPHKTIAFDMGMLKDDPLYVQTAVYLTCMLPYLDKTTIDEMCGKLKGYAAVKYERMQALEEESSEEFEQTYLSLQKKMKMIQAQMSEISKLYTRLKKKENKAHEKSEAKAGEEK
jgi:transcriptional regulator with XRE-family HTH domain